MGGGTDGESATAVVARVMATAMERRASDIYWLPRRECVEVRCRVAGRQVALERLERGLGEQCLTHIARICGGGTPSAAWLCWLPYFCLFSLSLSLS